MYAPNKIKSTILDVTHLHMLSNSTYNELKPSTDHLKSFNNLVLYKQLHGKIGSHHPLEVRKTLDCLLSPNRGQSMCAGCGDHQKLTAPYQQGLLRLASTCSFIWSEIQYAQNNHASRQESHAELIFVILE
jgi:hypothetical protein